jgi:hypothetical protein
VPYIEKQQAAINFSHKNKKTNKMHNNTKIINTEDAEFLKENRLKVTAVHFRRVKTPYLIKNTLGKIEIEVPVCMPMFEIRRQKLQDKMLATGGYTTVKVSSKDRKLNVVGESICHENDIFSNWSGLKIAFQEAIKAARAAHNL